MIDNEREVLPSSIKPLHYDIRFRPHLEEAIYFDAEIAIELLVVEPTSVIVVNAADLDIFETNVVQDGSSCQQTDVSFDKESERMTISLNSTLKPGSRLQLKQRFRGSLLHLACGFYRSPSIGANGHSRWMASTHMEPTDARKVFPCFDEPALKATFTVTLVVDLDLTCLANMDVAHTEEIVQDGKRSKAVTFKMTPPMSTYIVAFAVGDFSFIETDTFHVPVRVYAPSGLNIEQGRASVELASRALKVFEKIFGIEYPLPKIDLIAIPGGQGAMENWGLVTFNESLLLVDEKATSAEAFRAGASALVHELAHQWFGNLVTMDFWDGLWLNESFADWAELYAWESLNPIWQMRQANITGAYQLGLLLDSNRASHPVEAPIYHTSEISQIFDDISYNKGSAIIRMVSQIIGIEKFLDGVRLYLQRHSYGNTKTQDLWDALGEISKTDIRALMETWTRKMGYPVLIVDEDNKEGKIVITQHRFLQDGLPSDAEQDTLYPVPLLLKTNEGTDSKLLMLDRRIKLTASLDFFKLNSDQTAFYRVAYTPERLRILAQNAKDGLLSETDIVGLLADALAMASSGVSSSRTSAVLTLIEDLQTEDSYFVWKQIFNTLSAIADAWSFEDEKVCSELNSFRLRLVRNLWKRTGWKFTWRVEDNEDSTNNTSQMFRALIFAESRDLGEVKTAANEMFDAFMGGDKSAININIRRAVFAAVLERGSENQYDQVFEASRHVTTLDDRDACLKSLGATRNAALISRTLNYALSAESLQNRFTQRILKSFTEYRAGKEALWNWIKCDWDLIERYFGGSLGALARLLQTVVSCLSTRAQYEDVKEFFQEKDQTMYGSYLSQSLNAVKAKFKWVERDRDDVKSWLGLLNTSP
ncbi:peptidase family M1-domain-containing protein [Limtongia smithiae]|uniref:peptidase family M1-domain-containing protein n=1 Tax=Limtongia smithiae TaxID=1125753 RepID=UPI0034CFD53B